MQRSARRDRSYESCDRFFFFKQKTAYEMRISDWSSDVCSSDLYALDAEAAQPPTHLAGRQRGERAGQHPAWVVAAGEPAVRDAEIGRASCRESVWQYVWISVVAGSLTNKTNEMSHRQYTLFEYTIRLL